MKIVKAKIGGKVYKLYVAVSDKRGIVGRVLTTLLQIRGLIGRNIKNDEGMLFPHEKMLYPIHTWFMGYAIDLIYCDENWTVIEVVKNLKPFKHYYPKRKSCYLIEIRHNPDLDVKEGDKIEIVNLKKSVGIMQ